MSLVKYIQAYTLGGLAKWIHLDTSQIECVNPQRTI